MLASEDAAGTGDGAGEASAEDVVVFRTSHAQQRMWFLHRLDPRDHFYNIPMAVRVRGPLDEDAVRTALAGLVERHEVLRTSFAVSGEEPLQVVSPVVEVPWETVDLSGAGGLGDGPDPAESDRVRELMPELLRRPFDLARPPLFRVSLLRFSDRDRLLFFSMHHIMHDGWSLKVMERELSELYRAALEGRPHRLGPLPLQYGDFAEWQRDLPAEGEAARRLARWRDRLAAPSALDLPTDRVRADVASFAGARRDFTLPEAARTGLRRLCADRGATVYMVLLAAVAALLHRRSGQSDIAVGTPVAGRSHPDLEGLIGLFVNTLVMRVDLSGDPGFGALVDRARAVCLESFADQDTPFEQVVEEVGPERLPGRNPLFQVLLALQNPPRTHWDLPGVRAERLPVERGSTRFDLELHFWEHPDRVTGTAVYGTDLFDAASIDRDLHDLAALLAAAADDPGLPVSRLRPPDPPGPPVGSEVPTVPHPGTVAAVLFPGERLTVLAPDGRTAAWGQVGELHTADGAGAPEPTGQRARLWPTAQGARIDLVDPLAARIPAAGAPARPAEAERALAAVEGVADRRVVGRIGSDGTTWVEAYVRFSEDAGPPARTRAEEALRGALPQGARCALVPVEDGLPVGEAGLRPLSDAPPAVAARPAAATGTTARTVAELWCTVLGTDEVDAARNFFDAGGTSLRMARLQDLLRERTGRLVPMVDLFRHPTVGGLAAFLDGDGPGGADGARGRDRAERRRSARSRRDGSRKGRGAG
ncbi:condensation domain-containing protein [Nocardiopsis baichengensis]|uniref:condensation domain-containing protein n=1 Tax=Nocardiopsis baichengensis TaxID=280240 RepID=UPI000349A9E9|nr:condensation domain-containing protein [Nocardiopsis baichengensis]